MEEWKQRTSLLLGEKTLDFFKGCRILVVGVGGVGAYAAEMVVRAGIGHIVLMDSDYVSATNKNRQLVALDSTMGRSKCDILKERLLDINPELEVDTVNEYLEADRVSALLDSVKPDFVIDAIDTVAPKLALVKRCYELRIPSVSSMGAGARMDATKVRLEDISKTFNCSLAMVVRKRLRKMGITRGVKVVFSEEVPDRNAVIPCKERNKCSMVGTISYLPAVFGCVCAQAAIRSLSAKALSVEEKC